ncbi:hypothetical protein J1614_005704 [Plenodomus biglobosus]|nr:hypothetical protein J1614_005704 [Plenodomus biglobosus]
MYLRSRARSGGMGSLIWGSVSLQPVRLVSACSVRFPRGVRRAMGWDVGGGGLCRDGVAGKLVCTWVDLVCAGQEQRWGAMQILLSGSSQGGLNS